MDEEEENEDSRVREAQARQELENDGCPPCYPPYLDIPLRNLPEECQAIVEYWQSFPGTGDVPLCAQNTEWRKFRAFQSRVRRQLRNKSFSKFENEVRERRRRYQLSGDVRLILHPKQQSRLENWIEFQNYHLERLEWFEKKRDELKQELNEAQKKLGVTDVADSKCAVEDAEIVQQILNNAEWELKRHKVLLQWIEQKRWAIGSEYSTFTEEDNDDQNATSKAVRRISTYARQKRRPETSVILGKVRVVKAMPKKRNTHTQKPKASELESLIQDSNAIPQSSIPQASKRRQATPRRVKEETPLRQVRPQRVANAKRFTDARVKPLSGTQNRSAEQTRSSAQAQSKRRPALQQSQPAPENVISRSGRRSRPPVRWAPV